MIAEERAKFAYINHIRGKNSPSPTSVAFCVTIAKFAKMRFSSTFIFVSPPSYSLPLVTRFLSDDAHFLVPFQNSKREKEKNL